MGVQEMNACEIKETDGGVAPLIVAGLVVLFIILSEEEAK